MTRSFVNLTAMTALLAVAGCQQAGDALPFPPTTVDARALGTARATPPTAPPARPDLPANPALRDYLIRAALNNRGLEAAFNRWQAALERVPQVRSLPDPRFTYGYFIEAVETRVGPLRQLFGGAQTLPWFGKLGLAENAAMEAANAERQRYQAEKLKLFYKVKQAYYEYSYLWHGIAVLKENMQLLQNIEKVVQIRYKVGAAEHSNIIRIQLELGTLDDRLRSLIDLRSPIVADLNAALNRNPSAPLPWPSAVGHQQVAVNEEQLLELLEHTNPEVRALDFEIARTRHEIKLAKKQYFPDVTFGLTYIDVGNTPVGRQPVDDGKNAALGTVSINVPIWWNKLSAGVRESRYRHYAALLQKAEKINTLSAAVKLAAYRFRDADRKVSLYRDTLLPKAQESLKATETAFRAGKASYTGLIDVERILLEFELSYQRAAADRAQRLAELEMLTGREIN